MADLFTTANPAKWTWKEWAIIGSALVVVLLIGIAIGVARSKAKSKNQKKSWETRYPPNPRVAPLDPTKRPLPSTPVPAGTPQSPYQAIPAGIQQGPYGVIPTFKEPTYGPVGGMTEYGQFSEAGRPRSGEYSVPFQQRGAPKKARPDTETPYGYIPSRASGGPYGIVPSGLRPQTGGPYGMLPSGFTTDYGVLPQVRSSSTESSGARDSDMSLASNY